MSKSPAKLGDSEIIVPAVPSVMSEKVSWHLKLKNGEMIAKHTDFRAYPFFLAR